VAAKEGAAQNRTSITNQPPGVGKVEMGFFASLLGISINTTGLSVSNNGLFPLTMIGLLKAAEASSKLLTPNQSETHRYTTIGMASMFGKRGFSEHLRQMKQKQFLKGKPVVHIPVRKSMFASCLFV